MSASANFDLDEHYNHTLFSDDALTTDTKKAAYLVIVDDWPAIVTINASSGAMRTLAAEGVSPSTGALLTAGVNRAVLRRERTTPTGGCSASGHDDHFQQLELRLRELLHPLLSMSSTVSPISEQPSTTGVSASAYILSCFVDVPPAYSRAVL